jgi:hypothetical protein
MRSIVEPDLDRGHCNVSCCFEQRATRFHNHQKGTTVSELIRNDMHDKLDITLPVIATAFARVDIRMGDPSRVNLDTDIYHWQSTLWNAADDLDGLNTPDDWWSTIGLEDAAREWVGAADAYSLYRQTPSEWRERAFGDHMAKCETALRRLIDGGRWTVRG